MKSTKVQTLGGDTLRILLIDELSYAVDLNVISLSH